MSGISTPPLDLLMELLVKSLSENQPLDQQRVIEVVLAADATSEKALLLKATQEQRRGDLVQAERTLASLLNSYPANKSAQIMLRDCLLGQLPKDQIESRRTYIDRNDIRKRGAAGRGPDELAEQLRYMERLNPSFFDLWTELYYNCLLYNVCMPISSCAIAGNATGETFHRFIKDYLEYPLLDVGCGSYGVPYYLSGCEESLLFGIDPAEPLVPHPFSFVRGFNEFLPYENGFFHAIVNGGSLDHCLHLEAAIAETARVLRRGGRFFVLIGDVPNSSLMNVHAPSPKATDRFHLFHFNRKSFEHVVAPYFSVVRIQETPGILCYDLLRN